MAYLDDQVFRSASSSCGATAPAFVVSFAFIVYGIHAYTDVLSGGIQLLKGLSFL
jgi:hypothetical protein